MSDFVPTWDEQDLDFPDLEGIPAFPKNLGIWVDAESDTMEYRLGLTSYRFSQLLGADTINGHPLKVIIRRDGWRGGELTWMRGGPTTS